MLPLAGDVLAYEAGRKAARFVAALIIVPQLIVARALGWAASPKTRSQVDALVGLAVLPIRAGVVCFDQ